MSNQQHKSYGRWGWGANFHSCDFYPLANQRRTDLVRLCRRVKWQRRKAMFLAMLRDLFGAL